ncbi:MAG TPA: hypothetical protein VMV81_01345 [Phycisphaerae bacterium]|nr:hypothetical protein [Phycisphaerae bacterium]
MGFLKSKWRLLAFVGICLLSIGGGAWAYMSGSEVTDNMKKLDDLRKSVDSVKNIRANSKLIEERKKAVEKSNADFEKSMNTALAVQKNNAFEAAAAGEPRGSKPRALILDKSLPKPTKAVAINFKDAYAKAFDQLKARLNGRDKATTAEITRWKSIIQVAGAPKASVDLGPWGPPEEQEGKGSKKDASLPQALREYPPARAADEIARKIRMYVTDNALGRITKGFAPQDVPTDVEIWQAQMSLWIQQDVVDVLARMNEERIEKLKSDGRADDCWVAYLPVKHLMALRIDGRLGKGGGSNLPKNGFAASFTGINNDDKLFKVPIQVEVVIEEAALMDLIDRFCRQGFFTPVSLTYEQVKPDPMLEAYVYGQDPVLKVSLELEAYYFRPVFDAWIPDSIKPILKTPNAVDKSKP